MTIINLHIIPGVLFACDKVLGLLLLLCLVGLLEEEGRESAILLNSSAMANKHSISLSDILNYTIHND